MNRLVILVIGFFCLYVPCLAQQKQVCFTLDDLPVVAYGTDSVSQKDIFNRIIRALKSNNVPAIGFVNEGKLHSEEVLIPYQVQLLKNWVSSGLDLGNHTYSHNGYNTTPFDLYTNSILTGEIVTKKILTQKNKQIKYFRHPYLQTGNTKAKADSLTDFLHNHHYVVAPVTIDNEDYLFALAYSRTKQKNDTALMSRIGRDYVSYMDKKITYYEKQSKYLFGRNISHTLLMHNNLLNADYLDKLVALYKTHNYAFVSLDEALKDPAYQTKITVFGNWGMSWIDRWALSLGKKELLKEDPEVPDYIKKMSE